MKTAPKKAILSAIKEVRSILPPTTQPKTPPAKRGKNLILNLIDSPSEDLVIWKFYNNKIYKDLLQKVIDRLDNKDNLSKTEVVALKSAKNRIKANKMLKDKKKKKDSIRWI